MNNRVSEVAGFVAILLWALFSLGTRFVHGVPPFEMMTIGFSVASLAGLILLSFQKRLGELKQRPIVWLHGVGGIFGFNALLFAAFVLAPPTQAVTINYSWPLLTIVLSALITGIRLRFAHGIGLALGLAGCVMLAMKGEQHGFSLRYWPGYLCAFCSSLTWATYSALSSKLGNVPSGALAGFYAVIAFLSFGVMAVFEHPVHPDHMSVVALVALGLGPMGIAYFLWDFAVKHGNPVFLGALSYLCPAMSYLFIALAGYAPLGPLSITAMLLMLIGSGIAIKAEEVNRLMFGPRATSVPRPDGHSFESKSIG